ncbi:5' nucleotidase, NT5C type [Desulfosediminicola flagellatus]|uniref:5' nucleotidase, NT5C type n=1 Tax=Desulfosediminicola flagellatus TaxID=2569541 RepID=UPI0010AC738A|nr:hypothetical protein [Desulfosediminicola flagellatus]
MFIKKSLAIHPAEIGFDLDGVIADTAETFLRLACEKHEYCSFTLNDITSFEIENCISIPTDLVERIFFDIMQDSLSTGLQPISGAVEVLGELACHAPITVITARPFEQPVIDWFDTFFPPTTREAIKVIAMGDHDDKLKYIREHGIKYFVDDRAETCNKLAEAGITPLVFSHPWNHDRHNLNSVQNWQEIRELLVFSS